MAANVQMIRREDTALQVTTEQLELVKRTVAQGATDAELKLFLYDCQRQGVHPLDRLLHFTKRGGKYTPITSIDLMRSRAADTGEYAGSEDALFAGTPKQADFSATVMVWRFVQGQRCSFTATARWSEYCPEKDGFMWNRMPHTMLAKVAESLALRKGFPKQLGGLYASEEMDQAGPVHMAEFVEEPKPIAAPQASPLQQEIIDLWKQLEGMGDEKFANGKAKLAHLQEIAHARQWDKPNGLREVSEDNLSTYKSILIDRVAGQEDRIF